MLPEKSVDLRPNRFWSRASCPPRLQGEQQDATTTRGIFGAIRSFQKKRFGSWFLKGFVDRFCSWCRRLRVRASLGQVLHAIWNLSDVDKDGALTLAEFALAKHFIKMKLEGQDLPPTLPPGFA